MDSFRCKMTVDSTGDTPIGFIGQWSLLFCAIEEELGGEVTFNGEEELLTGFDPNDSSEACQALFPEGLDVPDGGVSVAVTPTDISSGDSGWEKQLVLDIAGFTTIYIYYADTDDSFALKVRDNNNTSAVTINRTAGVLNYESLRLNGDQDEVGDDLESHSRMKVSGTINEDFEFSDVSAVQGIDAVCHEVGCTSYDNSGDSWDGGYSAAIISGTLDDLSYETIWWVVSGATTGDADEFDGCDESNVELGTIKDCVSQGSVAFDFTVDPGSNAFFTVDNGAIQNFHEVAGSPLCFDTVNMAGTGSGVPQTAALDECELTADE